MNTNIGDLAVIEATCKIQNVILILHQNTTDVLMLYDECHVSKQSSQSWGSQLQPTATPVIESVWCECRIISMG